MSKPVPKFPTSGIYPWVKQYIQSLPTLHGKVALDIPCGDGRATAVLRESGADVLAYDLFPESFLLDGQAQFADLAERLPLPDDSIDIVVCQEGIEHLPNQLLALQEFHRVLKPGGTLVITTPNISNLVGRLANLVFESQLLRDTPYAAEESAWRMEHTGPGGASQTRTYYGHIFLAGVQRLRTLHRVAGFTDIRELPTHKSTSSLLLSPFLLPIIVLLNLKSMWRARRRLRNNPVLWTEKAQLRTNLSRPTLFNRNLFLVSQKSPSAGVESA
ncbi:methyltransferase domain-containing protein [Achromobacter xylosoxidans]